MVSQVFVLVRRVVVFRVFVGVAMMVVSEVLLGVLVLKELVFGCHQST